MRPFLLLLCVLITGQVHAEPSYYNTMLAHPAFTGKLCAEWSPGDLMAHLRLQPIPGIEVNFSEAGIDGFYDVYATRLAQHTDSLFPVATAIRPAIQKAFEEIHVALVTAYGGSGRHTFERLPGKVEWIIHTNFAWQLEKTDAVFSDRHIQQAVRIFTEAHPGSPKRFAEVADHVARALEHLHQAEKKLDRPSQRYFRTKLMGMIGEFYGTK